MCNLFENTVSFADLVRAFGNAGRPVLRPEPAKAPNWPLFEAVRPTDPAPIVRAIGDGCEALQARWGFLSERPQTSGKRAPPVTNFRSEGRRFANAEDRGRCLVPATAFYEFTGNRSPKTRWRFTEAGQPWFCLAGLWRRHGDGVERFTLLTTEPGPDMAPYHNRQVVVAPRDAWADWLSGAPEAEILKAGPAGALKVVQDSPDREAPPALPLFGGAP
jgi:putative SOS response-associated peptidase YedK